MNQSDFLLFVSTSRLVHVHVVSEFESEIEKSCQNLWIPGLYPDTLWTIKLQILHLLLTIKGIARSLIHHFFTCSRLFLQKLHQIAQIGLVLCLMDKLQDLLYLLEVIRVYLFAIVV